MYQQREGRWGIGNMSNTLRWICSELLKRGYIRKDLFGKWNYNCISYAEELKRSKRCGQNVRIVDTK
jgi:hypothetical protein